MKCLGCKRSAVPREVIIEKLMTHPNHKREVVVTPHEKLVWPEDVKAGVDALEDAEEVGVVQELLPEQSKFPALSV